VDNRGGDIVPGELVARAQPDGHTLLVTGSSFWLVPFLYSSAPWDPIKDFLPVTLAANSPNILSVHPSVPVNSVKELIAFAKARPGAVNYSAGGAVGATTLAAELFISMAGVNIVRINYKGGGPAVLALVAGEVHLTFATTGATTPFVKAGKLRPLAITSAQPSPLAPNLPTVAASGLPGYESGASYAVFVPVKSPAAAINRLNHEIVRALNRADVKEKFFNTGVRTVGSSPEELAATVKSEMIRLGKVIKDVGLRPE
jgi:tripartite-type tricarboxylate transporter receptor subunit TctC